MYLAIDVGGTKTLVGVLDDEGVITERQKFPTAADYGDFKKALADSVASLSTHSFTACGVALPGKIDRKRGLGMFMGNLPWQNVPIKADVAGLVDCPIVVENDAKMAALSEAMLLKDKYQRVLYVTISTGIGVGLVIDQVIDPGMQDGEGGLMMLEHQGKLQKWESFASGRAIFRRFGKEASEIDDPATWEIIAKDIAVGLIDLIAVIQPQVIVLGGGMGGHFERYQKPLKKILADYETAMVPIPPIIQAARPDDAVLYGCYDLAKATYGKPAS